jgi:hypothetical protein
MKKMTTLVEQFRDKHPRWYRLLTGIALGAGVAGVMEWMTHIH